jgi:hypothetical protein
LVHNHEKIDVSEHERVEDRLQCQQEKGIGRELLFRQTPVHRRLNQRTCQNDKNIGGKQPDRDKEDEEEEIA